MYYLFTIAAMLLLILIAGVTAALAILFTSTAFNWIEGGERSNRTEFALKLVALFCAIAIVAAPLAGGGFAITKLSDSYLSEHTVATGTYLTIGNGDGAKCIVAQNQKGSVIEEYRDCAEVRYYADGNLVFVTRDGKVHTIDCHEQTVWIDEVAFS